MCCNRAYCIWPCHAESGDVQGHRQCSYVLGWKAVLAPDIWPGASCEQHELLHEHFRLGMCSGSCTLCIAAQMGTLRRHRGALAAGHQLPGACQEAGLDLRAQRCREDHSVAAHCWAHHAHVWHNLHHRDCRCALCMRIASRQGSLEDTIERKRCLYVFALLVVR